MVLSRILKAFGASSLLALTAMSGCSDDDEEKAAGSEGGPCYGNGTCNPGLSCLSQLCVATSGSGGNAGAGGSNAGGGKGGSGGKAGSGGSRAEAGASGSTTEGGSTGSGGTSNGGAPGAAGEAGAGGAVTCDGATLTGRECNQCFVANCCDEFLTCQEDAECFACIMMPDCTPNDLYQAFDMCLNTVCLEACGG
jgi:hypothetical protein